MAKNPRLIDLAGQQFGLWSVDGQAGNAPRGGAMWLCRCACGTERPVLGGDLRNGKSISCGCQKAEKFGALRRSHGQSGTRLHQIWKNMRARCSAKEGKSAENYSSRGISICSDWNIFANFQEWANISGYADDLTIERVDVNGHYTPDNCAWIPAAEQAINRRFVQRAPDGELWWHKARANGITEPAYRQRVAAGWSMELATTWPMGTRREPRKKDRLGRFAASD